MRSIIGAVTRLATVTTRSVGIATTRALSTTSCLQNKNRVFTGNSSRLPRIIEMNLNRTRCKTKTFAIVSPQSGEAIIIDPVLSETHIAQYLAVVAAHGCRVSFVVDTHTHADHITQGPQLAQLTGGLWCMHSNAPNPKVGQYMNHGDVLRIGDTIQIGQGTANPIDLRVLHTPGHTPDSISLFSEALGSVFTGDALLIGGAGRTDFAGGDPAQSYDSIVNHLFDLPDKTVMYPGHDYNNRSVSTIGYEKNHNPRVAGKSKDEYVTLMETLFTGVNLPESIMEAIQINADAAHDITDNLPTYHQLIQANQVSAQEVMEISSAAMNESASKAGNTTVVLDVRLESELDAGDGMEQIPGSLHLPIMDITTKAAEVLKGRENDRIICVCRAGVRSSTATVLLNALGFPHTSNMLGGMLAVRELRSK